MSDLVTRAGTVHHVSFRVNNLEESLKFYLDVLGCSQLDRPDNLGGVRGAWLQAGATQVHLMETPATDETGYQPKGLTPNSNHVAFRTDDIDAAEKAFRDLGYEVRTGTTVRQFFVSDPSGNLIEFTPA